MTVGRAAADSARPHAWAIAAMAAVAVLVPMIVFGDRIALLIVAAGAAPATLFMVVRHPRASWLAAVACLPVTTAMPIATTGATVSMPLEVLAGLLAPLVLLALLRDSRPVRRLLLHPLSIALGFQLAWMTAATVFSTDPASSTKAVTVRVVYLTVFYLGGLMVLSRTCPQQRADPVQTTTLAVLFLAIPTTLWTLARHAPSGFARRDSYEIAQPFFSNHTEYATVMVVWLCLAVGLRWNSSARYRRLQTAIAAVILAAVLVAGARSAWIALLTALMILTASRVRPEPWRTVAAAAMIVLLTGAMIAGLSKRREGTPPGDGAAQRSMVFADPVIEKPLGDESGLERFNRWSSALRMIRDRPLFGFGPATYEVEYGTYQQHQELTRVSTFAGDRGGAHSDFMTVAAEHGLGGLAALLAVMTLGLRSGLRAVRHAADSRDRRWAAAWTAALAGLIVSGCFNSLLELDKTAPLFWLAAAVLVHLDLRSNGSPEHVAKHYEGPLGGPRPAEDA